MSIKHLNLTKFIHAPEMGTARLFRSKEFADIYFVFDQENKDVSENATKCDGSSAYFEDSDIVECQKDAVVATKNTFPLKSNLQEKSENVKKEDANKSQSSENSEFPMLPAHKVILAAGSEVFKDWFFSRKPDKLSDEQKPTPLNNMAMIQDVTLDAFAEFLQFFYLDKQILTKKNVSHVIKCAKEFEVPYVIEACKNFLKSSEMFNVHTVCAILDLAIEFKFFDLIKMCEECIGDSAIVVLYSYDFQQCSRFTLRHILSMEKLNCSELEVYNACKEWVKKNHDNKANMRNVLAKDWYLIRFPTMKIEQFRTVEYKYFEKCEYDALLEHITTGKKSDGQYPYNETKRVGSV